MDSIVNFLNELAAGLESMAVSFVSVINYVLFFASLILIVTMIIADQRGQNIGFNAGKVVFIMLISAVAITLAKEIYGIA